MLGELFKRRRDREQRLFIRRAADKIGHNGPALRDGAGLVEHDRVDAVRRFQRFGRLDEDAIHRAAARADHDGRGGCKAQCAGAADDQHRNADGEREFHAVPRQEPRGRRDDGDCDDHGDKHAAHLVGELGDGGLGARGLVHKAHDLGKGGIVADLRCAHLEVAGFVDRRADDAVADLLLDGDALARQRGFIDRGRALEHQAVHGDALARLDDQLVAELHLLDGDDALRAVTLDRRGLGRKVHELGDRVGGLALGARLHGLAHGDERQDRAGGLEVQLHHIGVHHVHVHLAEADADLIDGINAVDDGGAGAEGDERIHVRRALPQRPKADNVVLAVDIDDGEQQQKLREGEGHRVLHAEEARRQRPAHHVPHREVEEGNGKNEREGEALFHAAVGLLRGAGAALFHGGSTAGLCVQGRAVARLFDRGDDLRGRELRFVVFHDHAVFQQVDRDLLRAGLLGNSLFHADRAGGAAHAGHVIGFLFQLGSSFEKIQYPGGVFLIYPKYKSEIAELQAPFRNSAVWDKRPPERAKKAVQAAAKRPLLILRDGRRFDVGRGNCGGKTMKEKRILARFPLFRLAKNSVVCYSYHTYEIRNRGDRG